MANSYDFSKIGIIYDSLQKKSAQKLNPKKFGDMSKSATAQRISDIFP